MKKTVIITFIVLMTGSILAVPPTKVGSAGAQFLKIGVGPRYQAMGEAAAATARDVYSLYWNPAGLAEIENVEIAFTRVNWVLDINLNYAAIAKTYTDVGTFGASVTVLSMGEQDVTSASTASGFTGERFNVSSYSLGVSFARQLTTRFAFGVTAKYLGEKIYNEKAQGYAFDVGTVLRTGFRSLRLGMAISNLGPEMQFSGPEVAFDGNPNDGSNGTFNAQLKTTPYDLPLLFRVGLAYDFVMGPKSMLTMAAEMKHPNDNEQQGAVGGEYSFDERYFLRAGYKLNYEEESFALGGGLITTLGEDLNLHIDYSWQDLGRLTSTQRFSLGFSF